ncbi:MAG: hypothetical protein ACFN26_03130 [Kingella denitrificans]
MMSLCRRLISLVLNFALWLAIFMALGWGIRNRPAQQYAEGDEISSLFAVAVRNAQGEIQAQPLNRWKSSETLVREDTVLRDREGIYLQLTRLPPDTFELFYASNNLNTESALLDAGGDAGEPLKDDVFRPLDEAFRFLQPGAVEVRPQNLRVDGEPGGHGGYSSTGGVTAVTAAMISALVLPLTSTPS